MKSLIQNLVANQNTIALTAIAITSIGGSIAMAIMLKAAQKDMEAIDTIIAEFHKNYNPS